MSLPLEVARLYAKAAGDPNERNMGFLRDALRGTSDRTTQALLELITLQRQIARSKEFQEQHYTRVQREFVLLGTFREELSPSEYQLMQVGFYLGFPTKIEPPWSYLQASDGGRRSFKFKRDNSVRFATEEGGLEIAWLGRYTLVPSPEYAYFEAKLDFDRLPGAPVRI